ncbi:MAG: LysR family transcriptional regulator [Oscillospiraceae bacterium]|nr:LysR family transcriptional regulator [Oscillospiraceae bacterium]
MTEMQVGSFLAVAETLNFSRAAEQMSISQPTLSKHIKLLEESLGFSLLERNRSAVSLTPEGVLMYHTLRGVRDQIKLSVARSRSGNVGGRKKVGIAIMRGLSVSRIPALKDAIANYQAAEQGNEVILMRADVKELWSMFKSGDADVVVLPEYVSTDGRMLEAVPLCRSKAVLFSGAPDELKVEKGELNLPDCNLITVRPEGDVDYYEYFSKVLEHHGLDPARCSQTNSISGMLNAAAAGLGAAVFFDVSYLCNDPALTWRELPGVEVGIQALFGLKSGTFLRFLGCLQQSIEELYGQV